jgi:hypothetical protein
MVCTVQNQSSRQRYIQLVAIATWIGLFAAPCANVQAQTVQKCIIDGHAVFQSSPCPAQPLAAVNVAAPAPTEIASAPKKKTLADLLRERDGANPSHSRVSEFQRDGATVLRERMGAV